MFFFFFFFFFSSRRRHTRLVSDWSSDVCSSDLTSACLSNSRRTVSPAPPSKRTLSGTTIAARPCCFRVVKTCWRKLSCLLLVLAQKSSRCTTSDCFSSSPASLTIVTLLFFPNGGLVSTIPYSPCLPASASFTITGTWVASLPMPCITRFMQQSRATLSTSSTPRSCSVLRKVSCFLSSLL